MHTFTAVDLQHRGDTLQQACALIPAHRHREAFGNFCYRETGRVSRLLECLVTSPLRPLAVYMLVTQAGDVQLGWKYRESTVLN